MSSKPAEKRPTLHHALRSEMKLRNYSHKTVKAYRSCRGSFTRYVSPRHPRDASDSDIRRYLLYLIDAENYAMATVNHVVNALRFLYVELYNSGTAAHITQNNDAPFVERAGPTPGELETVEVAQQT